jgi:hypothetical protein
MSANQEYPQVLFAQIALTGLSHATYFMRCHAGGSWAVNTIQYCITCVEVNNVIHADKPNPSIEVYFVDLLLLHRKANESPV